MFISAAPTLRPLDLVLPPRPANRFPSAAGDREWFFSRGCGALEALLQGFNLLAGQDVLVPSFLCRDVVEVFEAASVSVTLYSIDARGRFDSAEIARKISPRTRAVYVVHYFGFPQQLNHLQRLTREAGVELIEDCAHALFGRFEGRWLGEFGDASVFSLRKALPLPDGGALVVNGGRMKPPAAAIRLCATTRAGGLARLLSKAMMFQLQWRLRGSWRTDTRSLSVTAGAPRTGQSACAMSAAALRVFKRADVSQITHRRRANFLFYLDRLGPIALYRELPEGVVPFSFPVLVKKRDAVACELTRRGLSFNMGFPEAPVIGSAHVGDTDLSGAKWLAAQVLELPLHQDLRSNHLEHVIDIFNRVA